MTHDDFEKEPIPGLPARLPEGENIVWQGKPDQAAFQRNVLHTRKLVVYFGLIFVWNVGTAIYDGKDVLGIVTTGALTILLGAVVYGLAWWFARAVERTTIYTITNKRVVMRFGIALPITFNFPFSQITSADVLESRDGKGNIALSLKEHTKISWVILWPHARPWKLAKPQPALRAINDVAAVAQILADGLKTANGNEQTSVERADNSAAATPRRSATQPNLNTTSLSNA